MTRVHEPIEPPSDDSLDASLHALGGVELDMPPLSPELKEALTDLEPVKPRRPYRTFAFYSLVSLLYGAVILGFARLRIDLEGLSTLWVTLYCAAWLAGFLSLGWFVLIPGRGKIMPNWRHAGIGAILAAVGFISAGLLFDRHVPGLSHLCNHAFGEILEHGTGCLGLGLLTAVVPILAGVIALRGAVPVGSRWAGAGLGAAGGSLGGLLLHLYCHKASAFHLGFVHGGVVVLAAVIGALVLPRASRL